MASTRDLQSQAETERSHIAATLDELRSRMSTGRIVDQALDINCNGFRRIPGPGPPCPYGRSACQQRW